MCCAISSLVAQIDLIPEVAKETNLLDGVAPIEGIEDLDEEPIIDGSFGMYFHVLDGRSEFGNNLDRPNFGFSFDFAAEHTPSRIRTGLQFGMAFLGSRHRDFEVPVAGFLKEYREETSTSLLDLAVPVGFHPRTNSRLNPYLQLKTGVRWMHTSTTLSDLNDNTEDPYSETDVIQSRAAWLYGGAVGLEYRISDCVSIDARAEYTGTPNMSYMLPTDRAPGEPPVTDFKQFNSPVDAVTFSVGVRFTFSGCDSCDDDYEYVERDCCCDCRCCDDEVEYRRPKRKRERRAPRQQRHPDIDRTPAPAPVPKS